MLLTQNSTNPTRQWLTDLTGLIIFLVVFYALWIGSYALFTPDEGRYSEVAREMVVSGDYVTPRLNGVAFLDKPVLYYWLQASAIRLFGIKEWALRLWPALIGILGCVTTYIAGRLLFNRRTGLFSALILATSPLYYGAAHYANLDLEVAVLVSNALLFFIIAMRPASSKSQQFSFLILAYIFAALATLTKGLIGIVFPAMIIGAWILLLNRWNVLKKMHLIKGLLIFTLITIPWYILVQKANPEFFQFFFVKQQVSRFLTTEHFNNRTVVWFYLPIVIAGTIPWCVFIIQAVTQHIKNVWQNRSQYSSELFLLLWLFLVFIFFSIPKSKTIGYILPIFPAIALLVGSYLSQCWEKSKSQSLFYGKIAYLFICAFLSAACLSMPYFKFMDLDNQVNLYLIIIGSLFLISGSVIGLLFKKTHLKQFCYILFLTVIPFLLVISASGNALNQKTIKPLAMQIKSQLSPNDEIVTYYKYYQDMPIYLERRITIVEDWNSPKIPLNDNWIRELWYGMPFQDTKEWLISEVTLWQNWILDNKRIFVFTDKSLMTDIESKLKFFKKEFYKIAEYNDTIVISNRPLAKNPQFT